MTNSKFERVELQQHDLCPDFENIKVRENFSFKFNMLQFTPKKRKCFIVFMFQNFENH